jgi:hypothetical protein
MRGPFTHGKFYLIGSGIRKVHLFYGSQRTRIIVGKFLSPATKTNMASTDPENVVVDFLVESDCAFSKRKLRSRHERVEIFFNIAEGFMINK